MSADVNGLSSPLVFALTLKVDDFHREWSRCSLLANYVGEYIAYQFAQRERAENLISTITNEFLESVIALAPSASRLSLSYVQTPDELRIEADHTVHATARDAYLDFLAGLDPNHSRQRYLELLGTEAQSTGAFNQLGLTMLTHDFGVLFRVQGNGQSGPLHTVLVTPIEALFE